MSTGESTSGVWLLGPLEVRVEGRAVPIVRPKQRALLAVLALEAGSCVSRERLIDELWGVAPPASAAHGLQVHVSGLRKLLGAELIVTCPGGYKLALDPDAVDAHRAAALLASGDPDAALALFRGAPLEDVALEGPAAQEAARLDDLRVAALEEQFDQRLAAGEGAALVGPLERLVAENPLRERPHGQLMLALYRAGRQADALAAFQDARRTFVEELGIEPSPALREVERAILQQDDSLAAGQAPATARASAATRGRRKRLPAVALLLAALASVAGVAAAYLIAPDRHPNAAATAPNSLPAYTHAARTFRPVASRVVAKKHAGAAHHSAAVATVKPQAHAHVRVVHSRPVALAPTTTHVSPAPPAPATTTLQTRTLPKIATHPTNTTPAPAPTTTAPAGPVRIVDTFDGGVVDQSTWVEVVNGTGAEAVQRNGKVVISIPQNAQPGGRFNNIGIELTTPRCFTGDVDMQVDYRLVDWPHDSSAYTDLSLSGNGMVERFSSPYGEGDIVGSVIGPRFVTSSASGVTGSLRVTRVSGTVTTYFLSNGAWQPIDSAASPNASHLNIGLSVNPGVVPTAPISVELDNFSATAAGPVASC